ncbi:hypothetical protein, conserved [Leishmania tarentolae]|uniref:Tyrosine-protein kinase ephrin type A/B receptor-like domain-containing protein n=1 Tax=Leishmania tarentolae TaxID=5689 RepID=A0A640KGC8_LEITA|nr:hypothetical protein, conserved [Leishmania tarentolae]
MRQTMVPTLAAGLQRLQAATLAVPTVATVLLVLVARCAEARPCTAADLTHFFLPCDTRTGTVLVLSYLPNDTDCTQKDLVVPPPRTTPCYNCMEGYYLDPLTLECAVCPIGTYSSFKSRYVTFDPLPDGMRTYCHPEPCASWSVVNNTYGTVISSGVQPTENRSLTLWGTVDESVDSTLNFEVVITDSSGLLEFDYSISSEESFDGLIVRLNNSFVTNPETEVSTRRFFASGVHRDWYHVSLPLPQGLTDVQFDYVKDSTGPPYGEELTGVNDRALLRNIEIKGAHKTVGEVRCVSCPPGYWTTTEGGGGVGASDCVRCPENTYRGVNDTQCLRCPTNTSSPEGASTCTPMRACVASDYIAEYSHCLRDNTRVRSWVKYEAANCVEVKGSRPVETKVACVACLPGMRHAEGGARGSCVSCPKGAYLSGDTCEMCPLGTAAVPILRYSSGFDGFNGDVTALPGISLSHMHCAGSASSCQSHQGKGFELVALPFEDEDNTLIGIRQQRLSNWTYSVATLNYTFYAEEDGWANITFAYVDAKGKYVEKMDRRTTMNVQVVVDDVDEYPVEAFATPSSKVDSVFLTLLVPYYVDNGLPASGSGNSILRGVRHRLSWLVEELAYTSNPISVVVVGLEVFGDVSGGVERCHPCRPGFRCPSRAAKMMPCEPGTVQSSPRAYQCEACTGNTHAPGYGFTHCLECPSDTRANADHTGCSSVCVFERNGVLYNFSELRGVVLNTTMGKIPVANTYVPNMTVEEADEAGIARFYFSPCDPLPVPDARATSNSDAALTPITRDRLCVPSVLGRNSSSSAYLCQRISATSGHHFGDSVAHLGAGLYFWMRTSLGTPYMISNFDVFTDDWIYEAKSNYVAYIEVVCNRDTEAPKVGTLQYVEGGSDVYLRWVSAYACSLCTENSYKKVETSCDDPNITTRSVYYTLRSESMNCVAGYVPPEPIIVNCHECTRNDYAVQWLECNTSTQTQEGVYVLIPDRANCTPGTAPLPAVKPRACNSSGGADGGKHISGKVVVVLLVILVLALTGFSAMTVYYRRLQKRFARAMRGEGAELDAYGGISDDPYENDGDRDPAEPSSLGRDRTSAAAQQVWGVVVSMGQHIRDAVSLDDVRRGGASAFPSAPDRSNSNGHDFDAASDGGSSENGGRDGNRDHNARGHNFSLPVTDDDLLPGPC